MSMRNVIKNLVVTTVKYNNVLKLQSSIVSAEQSDQLLASLSLRLDKHTSRCVHSVDNICKLQLNIVPEGITQMLCSLLCNN